MIYKKTEVHGRQAGMGNNPILYGGGGDNDSHGDGGMIR